MLRTARVWLTVVLLALTGIVPARAAAVTVSGTITTADRTMPVVFISPPNCTGQGASPVLYQAIRFFVTVSGTYTFRLLSAGDAHSLYLHETSFDPASSFPTCIGGDNTGDLIELTESLTALRQYIAVPFDDTFAQAGGFYTLTIEGPGAVVLGFADVPPGHFAERFIDALADANVTGGCGINPPVYCPDAAVTREQMAAFILKALGEFDPPVPVTQRFADVPPANPFYRFIDRLAALGITGGCGGGNYCPTAPVTREQMAAFVLRALGEFSPAPPATQQFLDVPPASPFYAFVHRLAALGITDGCGATSYCPQDPVTRAQMAVFLVRAFDL
jgi:hypothetical protein